MWEPLFLLNYETGQLGGWLARSLEPVNRTRPDVWRLIIRRGVTWSDGRPFTASDVVFTVKDLVLDNASLVAQEAVTLRQQVRSVAADRVTLNGAEHERVTFELKEPNPRFDVENFANGFFSSFFIMPAHIWRPAVGPNRDPADFAFYPPIGTGPYRLASTSETSVIWDRNDRWWASQTPPGGGAPFSRLPQPRRLEWRVLGGEAQSQAALAQNQVDAGREIAPTALRAVQRENNRIIGVVWNEPCARQIDINTLSEPWTDARLRRAVSLLIDRQALARALYGRSAEQGSDTSADPGTTPQGSIDPMFSGISLVSRTLFPEYRSLSGSIDAVVSAGYGVSSVADAAAADALLNAAGWNRSNNFYRNGDRVLSATILVSAAQPRDVAAAREVARQLSGAGVNAQARAIPHAQFWGDAVPKGDYNMVLSWLGCGSVSEPYTSLARYAAEAVGLGVRSPGFNNTGRWGTQAARDFSVAVRQGLGQRILAPTEVPSVVAQAYRYLHEEMPVVPLVQSPRIIPFNTTYWTGWPTQPGSAVPMHSWSSTLRTILALERASGAAPPPTSPAP